MAEVQITRAALGRIAHLGDLYDARSDKFCSTSILTKIHEDSISLMDNKNSKIDYIFSDKIADKFDKLAIDAELKASILAGCVDLHGNGEYLKNEKQSERTVRFSLVYSISTKHERLNLIEKNLKDAIDAIALNDERATHVVTEIYWGANATATIESIKTEEMGNKNVNVEGKLKATMFKIANSLNVEATGEAEWVSNENSSDNQFLFRVYADVLLEEKIPQTTDEVVDLLKNMPLMLQNSNNGKGKPISYIMIPISSVKKLITGVDSDINHAVMQLDESIIMLFTELFDEITLKRQHLNDVFNDIDAHKDYVNEKDIEGIKKYRMQFLEAENELRSSLHTTLINVRSGKLNCNKLYEILNQCNNEECILHNITTLINSFAKVEEKIKLINFFRERGIKYIGKNGSLELEKLKSESHTLYLLYFSDNSKDTHYHSWSEHFQFLLHLYRTSKQDNAIKFVVVDMTFPNNCNDIEVNNYSTITIRCYENGTYICNDVLAEHHRTMQFCFAKSDVQLEYDNIYKPNNRTKLDLRCPNSYEGNCAQDERTWRCWKCKEFLDYGIADNYIYCSCGRGYATDFVFKCCDEKHGPIYNHFPKNVLEGLLVKLKPMKELNVLIMGPTGVGKSTWINGIVNYLTYSSLDDAKNHMEITNKIINVIPTSFVVHNEQLEECQIIINSDPTSTNRELRGHSSTDMPHAYVLELKKTLVRLIDTPGIGDTRGVEQDKKNFANILNYIANLDTLHGICILLKPNDSRLDIFFRFCVKELLTHLHKSSSENIVFCFTNARSTFYKPGQTLVPLKNLLKEIKTDIPLTTSTVYCLDNEAYRFLCTLHYGIKYETEDYENFSKSWDKSVIETDRLFNHFANLKPHSVRDTICLNSARNIIVRLTEPLAEISRNIQQNLAIVLEKENAIKYAEERTKDLEKYLKIPEITLVRQSISYPRTVCTNKECVTYYKIDDVNVIEYTSHCHERCYLKNCDEKLQPNPAIKDCEQMDPANFICVKCHHDWNEHRHVTTELKRVKKEVIDDDVQNEINEKKSETEKLQAIALLLNTRIAALQNEQEQITKISAKFGCFLIKNAIAPYNDALADYLNYLIHAEETKYNKTELDNKALEGLKNMKEAYLKEVEILTTKMPSNNVLQDDEVSSVVTPEDIQQLEKQLYALPIHGSQIRQVIAEENMLYKYTESITRYVPEHFPMLANQKLKKSRFPHLKWLASETSSGLLE